MRFIGDIHGKVLPYLKLLEGVNESIQVGDFGVGFGTKGEPAYIDKQLDDIPGHHRFIRGNHDNPEKCLESAYYLGHDTYTDNYKMTSIGGALSIDKQWRTPGRDWWYNEELSYSELEELTHYHGILKPKIMVTHDAPSFLTNHYKQMNGFGFDAPSITQQAFEAMWNIHKPKLWIHGHWHLDSDICKDGCRFICLNELSYIDIDLNGDFMDGQIVPIRR